MLEHLPWKIENSIDRFMRGHEPAMEVVGSDSPTFLAGVLALPKVQLEGKPHLVLAPHQAAVEKILTSLRFISAEAKVHVLPSFDVSLYSNLYPSRAVDCAPQPASAVILVSAARIMKHRIDRKDTLANAFSCHLEQMIIPYQ